MNFKFQCFFSLQNEVKKKSYVYIQVIFFKKERLELAINLVILIIIFIIAFYLIFFYLINQTCKKKNLSSFNLNIDQFFLGGNILAMNLSRTRHTTHGTPWLNSGRFARDFDVPGQHLKKLYILQEFTSSCW